MISETVNCTVTEILQRAKSLLNNEDNAWVGKFPSLCAEIHVKRVEKKLKDDRFNNLNRLTTYITQDIWNIGTIITRLSWMREKTCHDDYLRQMWMYFAGVDISFFHIEIKSIMDYIAEIIAGHVDTQVLHKFVKQNKWLCEPQNSGKLKNWLNVPQKFAGLKQWLKKDIGGKRHLALGSEIARIVETTSWYDDISTVRNYLVHKGAHTLVFPQPEEGILFQIYDEGHQRRANNDFYIGKNNIASFERYAALYLSHLLIFLEDYADLLKHKLSFTEDVGNAKFFSNGFEVLVQWIDSSPEYVKKTGMFKPFQNTISDNRERFLTWLNKQTKKLMNWFMNCMGLRKKRTG